MRLEPTEQTIKKLFALSGNKCAFPECSVPMVDKKGTLLGQICHIEAASKGGERFNSSQTDEERRSFDNLLLLCPTHHVVTNNVSVYTAADMHKIKRKHEAQAKEYAFEIPKDLLKDVMAKLQTGQANTIYGDNATQAITKTGDVHVHNNYGLTREEAINLFFDLYNNNNVKLVAIAAATAKENVEKFAKEFFSKAEEKHLVDDISKFSSPDIQVMMNQAINCASRKDSEVLRKNLAALLVGRIKHDSDELKTIIYDEAIATVGKLTNNQVKILTIVFLLLHTSNPGIVNWATFNSYINEYVAPFLDFKNTKTDFKHLVYAGCASLSSLGEKDLGGILLSVYPFLFAKMVPQEEIDSLDLAGAKSSLFEFLEKDGKGFYVPKMTVTIEKLEENLIKNAGVKPEVSRKIVEVYNKNLKNTGEVIKDLQDNTDMGSKLAYIINDRNIRRLTLTSVGIVIAVSNYEQVTGSVLDIDNWMD